MNEEVPRPRSIRERIDRAFGLALFTLPAGPHTAALSMDASGNLPAPEPRDMASADDSPNSKSP